MTSTHNEIPFAKPEDFFQTFSPSQTSQNASISQNLSSQTSSSNDCLVKEILGMKIGQNQDQGKDLKIKVEFPIIESFFDILDKKDEIIRAVEADHDNDHVYHLKLQKREAFHYNKVEKKIINHKKPINVYNNWCVAGSAGLKKVIDTIIDFDCARVSIKQQIYEDKATEIFKNYVYTKLHGRSKEQPKDVDIFFLGSEVNHRMDSGLADFVHTTSKTVEELILNFDLPCCRAAYNSSYDFWISAQCLHAIFTGKYYLPKYITEKDVFIKYLIEHRGEDPMTCGEIFLHERYQKRIKKYQERGFEPIYYETNVILSWISNRYHYGTWFC